MKHYDYIIVGSGLFGAVFAHEAAKAGKSCLVLEKRDHVGGNVYCEKVDNPNVKVHFYQTGYFTVKNSDIKPIR